MESVVPNADRLITLLCTQPRWSVCDECLVQELAIELADLGTAIAELRANIVRLIPGDVRNVGVAASPPRKKEKEG